jgi:hypothetical protein
MAAQLVVFRVVLNSIELVSFGTLPYVLLSDVSKSPRDGELRIYIDLTPICTTHCSS